MTKYEYEQCANRKVSESWEDLAKRLGYKCKKTLQNKYSLARSSSKFNPPSVERVVEKDLHIKSNINQDGSIVTEQEIEIAFADKENPAALMKAHGFTNPDDWKLVSATNNFWNAQSKTDVLLMGQSKIVVKPAEDEITLAAIDKIISGKTFYTPKIIYPKNYDPTADTLESNICDLHLGKLAWSGDSGQDYDLKIAEEGFREVIADQLRVVQNNQLKKMYFIWSHDFFNYDNPQGNTTAGTPQSNDSRWQKMYDKGLELLEDALESFRHYVPVETFYVGANHDKMLSYCANKHLGGRFQGETNVIVDVSPIERKVRMIGDNLVGFMHGELKGEKASAWILKEYKELFGRARRVEIHAGHLHHKLAEIELDNGIIKRYLPALCGTDYWHWQNGWIITGRQAVSFIWNDEKGITTHINHYVE